MEQKKKKLSTFLKSTRTLRPKEKQYTIDMIIYLFYKLSLDLTIATIAFRLCLDRAFEIFCGILCFGLGQPTKDPSPLLHQLHLIARRLLSDSNLQLKLLQKHYGEPRSPLYHVGQSTKAAPSNPGNEGLQEDDSEQRSICKEIQEE